MVKVFTHRERLEVCLSGEKPDRIPVALWRHFPVDDQNSDTLACSTANFQKRYDFDLIKVTPASSYCLKDWGVEDQWIGHHHGTRTYTKRPIQYPEDWKSLSVLEPHQGQLGMLLETLSSLVKEFSPSTPIIHTIFSPLAQAKNLVGGTNLITHLRKWPDAVVDGLRIISNSTLRYIHEIKKTGIDGIFFAVQHAQYGLLSVPEFEKFGKQFDLQILHELQDFWLNFGHIHGEQIMFDQVIDYPVQILNWHDQETFPSISQARENYHGVICGGLKQEETMVLGTGEQVKREVQKAILDSGGKKFILGTGCVLPITAPHGNIIAATQSSARIA